MLGLCLLPPYLNDQGRDGATCINALRCKEGRDARFPRPLAAALCVPRAIARGAACTNVLVCKEGVGALQRAKARGAVEARIETVLRGRYGFCAGRRQGLQ